MQFYPQWADEWAVMKVYDAVLNVLQDLYRVRKNRIIGQVGKHPQWNGVAVYMFQVVMDMRVKRRSPITTVRSSVWPEMEYSFNDTSSGKGG